MKKNILAACILIICFVLQTTLFRTFSFGGIGPNLLIVLTASLGFMEGKKMGLTVGFFSGLLLDIFFGETIGFYALIYMFIGYINGNFKKIFFPEEIKLPIALITVSDIAYCFVCYIFLFLLRSKFAFGHYLVAIIIPEIVYTVLITMILYPVLLLIRRKLENSEQRSA